MSLSFTLNLAWLLVLTADLDNHDCSRAAADSPFVPYSVHLCPQLAADDCHESNQKWSVSEQAAIFNDGMTSSSACVRHRQKSFMALHVNCTRKCGDVCCIGCDCLARILFADICAEILYCMCSLNPDMRLLWMARHCFLPAIAHRWFTACVAPWWLSKAHGAGTPGHHADQPWPRHAAEGGQSVEDTAHALPSACNRVLVNFPLSPFR